jgi:site-specific recombinase XerD
MNKIDLITEQKTFLADLDAAGKSFNTIKNYKTDLNCFNKYLALNGRDLFINEMTHAEVADYNKFLEQTYNSPNSIRRRIQALRIFFDTLLAKGLVQQNPLKQATVAPKRVDKPNPTNFKVLIKLYELVSANIKSEKPLERLTAYRNLVLIELIYSGGLKVSDLEALEQKHVFRQQDGSFRVMITPPKRDPYTVELSQNFEKFHAPYIGYLEEQKQKDDIEFSKFFFNANPYKILAGGLSPRGIEVLFKEFGNKLGEKITAKSLRQSCIFHWINQNKPDSSIKEWIGVQPQYSLKPFHDLIKAAPEEYTFTEAPL